jgi:hypothetical protein
MQDVDIREQLGEQLSPADRIALVPGRDNLIYVRQSRHKEGERTVSPEVQEQQCRALPAVAA